MVIEKYSHSGYIYFIQDGEGRNIKIGFSGNPNERIKQLQIGNGKVFIPLIIQEGNEKKEDSYHEMFKEHHLHGEWFKPHDSILLFINSQKIKGETKLDNSYKHFIEAGEKLIKFRSKYYRGFTIPLIRENS